MQGHGFVRVMSKLRGLNGLQSTGMNFIILSSRQDNIGTELCVPLDGCALFIDVLIDTLVLNSHELQKWQLMLFKITQHMAKLHRTTAHPHPITKGLLKRDNKEPRARHNLRQ